MRSSVETMDFGVEMLEDSISEAGERITTMIWTMPVWLAAQFLTHASVARNAASSRAIPMARYRDMTRRAPRTILSVGLNRRGMVADENMSGDDLHVFYGLWDKMKDAAISRHADLEMLGVHKQIANRILMPYAWTRYVATAHAGAWWHMLRLRCHDDAQPEYRKLAAMAALQLHTSAPQLVRDGEWHLPYCNVEERCISPVHARRWSAARCARITYLADREVNPEADLKLAGRLEVDGHHSPFEHQATPLAPDVKWEPEHHGKLRGWVQHRKLLTIADYQPAMPKEAHWWHNVANWATEERDQ